MIMSLDEILEDIIEKGNIRLDDGVYDIADINVEEHRVEEQVVQKIKDWLIKYPKGCVADPFQSNVLFLLSKRPRKIDEMDDAYEGVAKIIDNCSKRILICEGC